MSPVIGIDTVPEEEIGLTGRVYAANVTFHARQITIVENDHPLCRLDMGLPAAPENTAAGETEQFHYFIEYIADPGLGDVIGRKDNIAVMGEEI
jgi:hypothetical protein